MSFNEHLTKHPITKLFYCSLLFLGALACIAVYSKINVADPNYLFYRELTFKVVGVTALVCTLASLFLEIVLSIIDG